MTTTIKKCTIDDLTSLQKISIATYTDTFSQFNSSENMAIYLKEAYNLEKLASELVEPQSEFYFIYLDETLAGYLKINSGKAQTEPMSEMSLEIERIYVHAHFKRKGLGQSLIAFAIKLAQEKQKSDIWLGVWEHNQPAKNFYHKMGFNQTGSHSFFMGDDEQIDYILTKHLV